MSKQIYPRFGGREELGYIRAGCWWLLDNTFYVDLSILEGKNGNCFIGE